jgi:hypothetical protein
VWPEHWILFDSLLLSIRLAVLTVSGESLRGLVLASLRLIHFTSKQTVTRNFLTNNSGNNGSAMETLTEEKHSED